MNIEENLIYKLITVANIFRDVVDKQLKKIGLHGGQTFVLFLLWETDGQSQILLANKLNLSAPTINKMVKSLSSNGFIKTRRCKKDKRLVRVYLTGTGLDCRNRVESIFETFEDEISTGLTLTEKLILMQILDKLKETQATDKITVTKN